ncbi:MAG: glycosyltransferase family 1 protein [Bacteroidia bacterium]
MARIAVNTRLLQDGKLEGIGWFTYETLKRVVSSHPEHEFLFIFDRPFSDKFIFANNVKAIYAGPPTRHVLLFIPWFEFVIPRLLRKHKIDLFLSPDGHIPLRGKTPTIAVIHDINFYHYPEQVPKLVRMYYNYFFPRIAKKATKIVTVSEFTRSDLVKSYGVDRLKIDVAYNGCNEIFSPLTGDEKASVRKLFSNGEDYFLFVGLIIPRKNLRNLIEAYFKFRDSGSKPVKLLVVGEKKWWSSKNQEYVDKSEYKNDVIFLGRQSAQDLHKLVASALALTFVPLFEGFGIPIVEAFASGTPVITSNVTSLPEVAGDAALLVNPLDTDEISEAMKKIVDQPELREMLITKGLERKKNFSWDKTASVLWSSISQLLG